jgi:hypothetical protein
MPDAPVLFISLGTSPAIVPEAYLLPGVRFRTVHVLTTERPDVALVREFFASHAPGAVLTLSRVAGFEDFTSAEDHFRFEEILYRWILAAQTRPEDRYLCLSGGFMRAPDAAFTERLRQVVERSHRIAGAWDQLHDLPFAELATCSETGLRWLREPLDPAVEEDQAWVADLPKIDLHCHLGGFATHGELLMQVRPAAKSPEQLPALRQTALPPGWPWPEQPIGLETYRHSHRQPPLSRPTLSRPDSSRTPLAPAPRPRHGFFVAAPARPNPRPALGRSPHLMTLHPPTGRPEP